jgi:hypothetical protein
VTTEDTGGAAAPYTENGASPPSPLAALDWAQAARPRSPRSIAACAPHSADCTAATNHPSNPSCEFPTVTLATVPVISPVQCRLPPGISVITTRRARLRLQPEPAQGAAAMNTEDSKLSLNPIEIEMLLAALEFYERKIQIKRSDSMFKAIRDVQRKLMIAAQRTDPHCAGLVAPQCSNELALVFEFICPTFHSTADRALHLTLLNDLDPGPGSAIPRRKEHRIQCEHRA